MTGIYAGYEAEIQYIDEDSQVGGSGTLGTNPGTGLSAIDGSPEATPTVSKPVHGLVGLGSRKRQQTTVIRHEAGITIKGKLQNTTFISKWLNPTYSYAFVARLLKRGNDLFEQFLGSKLDSLKITMNTDEPVDYEIGCISRQWKDNVDAFDVNGTNDDIVANMDDDEEIEWSSDSASDIGKYIMVYGLDTDDATYKYEIIGPLVTQNVFVEGTVKWSGAAEDIFGAVLLSSSTYTDVETAVGTITLRSKTTETSVLVLTVGEKSQGVYICNEDDPISGIHVLDSTVDIVADAATSVALMYHGLNVSEVEQDEKIALNGITPVTSANTYRTMQFIVTGLVANARTLTCSYYQEDPNSSWASRIATALYTHRNVTVQKIILVAGETPTGTIDSANKNFVCKQFPIADYDEDGNIDDVNDIIECLVDSTPDTIVSLDSSTGAFTTTTAPITTIVISYMYTVDMPNIAEVSIDASHGINAKWNPYSSTNTSPELARTMQAAGVLSAKMDVKTDLENFAELQELLDLGVITVISGTGELWGLQMKFGTSEAGDFKIRIKDGAWEPYSVDLAELELHEESLSFIGSDLNIF